MRDRSGAGASRASTRFVLGLLLALGLVGIVLENARAQTGPVHGPARALGSPDTGFIFHSSVPVEVRKFVVDDLVWLASLPELAGSERLASVLGYGEAPLDGRMLAAWLLHRVRFVAEVGFCPFHSAVVLDDGDPATLRFSNLKASCASSAQSLALVYGGDFWRRAAQNGRETDGVYFDDTVVIHPRGSGPGLPGVFLNLSLLKHTYGSPQSGRRDYVPHRVRRLIALFHEARHFDGYRHGSCGQSYLAAYPVQIRSIRFGQDRPDAPVCDDSTWGPQGLTGAFAATVARNCPDCRGTEVAELHQLSADQWRRVAVPLKKRWRLGELAAKAGLRDLPADQGKLLVDAVPHGQFFAEARNAAQARADRSCGPGGVPDFCRSARGAVTEIDGLVAMLAATEQAGEFRASWSAPSPYTPGLRPDPEAASAWLGAASRAEAAGFNVALRSVVGCARLVLGCLQLTRAVDFGRFRAVLGALDGDDAETVVAGEEAAAAPPSP